MNKSNQSRIVDVYCVKTLEGINGYISVYDDITKSKKNDFPLKNIKKIHKNYINDGKITIVL